jgi:hypothetical protein
VVDTYAGICRDMQGLYGRPHPHAQLGPPPPLLAGSKHYPERHGSADYGGSPKARSAHADTFCRCQVCNRCHAGSFWFSQQACDSMLCWKAWIASNPPSLLRRPQAQDHASYWHAGGRPHMAPLEAGGPTPSQMQAYLAAELERAHVCFLLF